jgi:hypothetical protein
MLLVYGMAVNSQDLWKVRRLEITGGAGMSQFFSDIGGYPVTKNILGIKDFTFLNTRYNLGAGARYRILKDVSVRLNLSYGQFHATDAYGANKSRGFEASTSFFESSVCAEYYFIKNKKEDKFLPTTGKYDPNLTFFSSMDFYVFAGVGGLSFNVTPNAALAPLASTTSGFTAVIPAGIGTTVNYSKYLNFGVEFGARHSFSDYLDGFSPAPSKYNDTYFFLNFTAAYKIKAGKGRETEF